MDADASNAVHIILSGGYLDLFKHSSYSTTSTIPNNSIMLEDNKPKYVHVVKHSSADTLLITIPRPYANALQLSKGDILKMQLVNNARIPVEKV
jgi:hypothetical protein